MGKTGDVVKMRLLCAGVILGTFGTCLSAQDVLLRALDGRSVLGGRLLPSDTQSYTIQTLAGPITIPRSEVLCEGLACPVPVPANTDLTAIGSQSVGERLLPSIIVGYAQSIESGVTQVLPAGPTQSKVIVQPESGYGEPVLSVDVLGAGSYTGLASLVAGEAQIAMSSRPATDQEVEALSVQLAGDLRDVAQDYVIGLQTVSLIVSPENPVRSLTMMQLADIYAGKIDNWARVGGDDQEINVYTLEKESAIQDLIMAARGNDQDYRISLDAIGVTSNRVMSDLVTGDPGGIGYVGRASRGGAQEVGLIDSCGKPLATSGFAAKSEDTPLVRRLRLYKDNGELPEKVSGLLEFSVSPAADRFVRQAGFSDLGVELLNADRFDLNLDISSYANEPLALRFLGQLVSNLETAERLSTTFRYDHVTGSLDSRAQRDLERVANFLDGGDGVDKQAFFVGYTDNQGNFTRNGELSNQRATDVMTKVQALRNPDLGDAATAEAFGVGELSPVACNDNPDGRWRNNRVEVWIK